MILFWGRGVQIPSPAQLRKHDADKRRGDEADSGAAEAQRLLHDGQHLRASGLQFQAVLSGGDAGGTGFEGLGGIKKTPPDGHQTEFGGSGGIRTHGPLRIN